MLKGTRKLQAITHTHMVTIPLHHFKGHQSGPQGNTTGCTKSLHKCPRKLTARQSVRLEEEERKEKEREREREREKGRKEYW